MKLGTRNLEFLKETNIFLLFFCDLIGDLFNADLDLS